MRDADGCNMGYRRSRQDQGEVMTDDRIDGVVFIEALAIIAFLVAGALLGWIDV